MRVFVIGSAMVFGAAIALAGGSAAVTASPPDLPTDPRGSAEIAFAAQMQDARGPLSAVACAVAQDLTATCYGLTADLVIVAGNAMPDNNGGYGTFSQFVVPTTADLADGELPSVSNEPINDGGPATSFGDGNYQVGVDVAPGLYRADAGAGCYWQTSADLTGDEIVNNEAVTVSGTYFAEILPTDALFYTEGCGTWAFVDVDNGPLSYSRAVTVEGDALPAFTREVQVNGGLDPGVGEEAPVVSGTDYAGDAITIDATADGPTMVVLLAHWCPHCIAVVRVLNEWRESDEFPDDLNVVGVSTAVDPNGDHFPPDEWLEEMDWQWSVLADADVAADDPDDDVVSTAFRAYGGTTFPTMLIIGSDGRVLVRFSGELGVEAIDALVDDALAQEAARS